MGGGGGERGVELDDAGIDAVVRAVRADATSWRDAKASILVAGVGTGVAEAVSESVADWLEELETASTGADLAADSIVTRRAAFAQVDATAGDGPRGGPTPQIA